MPRQLLGKGATGPQPTAALCCVGTADGAPFTPREMQTTHTHRLGDSAAVTPMGGRGLRQDEETQWPRRQRLELLAEAGDTGPRCSERLPCALLDGWLETQHRSLPRPRPPLPESALQQNLQ